jgi:hypothetical protein
VKINFYFSPFIMTASATGVKAVNVLRQCYNSLNVSHSAHSKKCFTCVPGNQKEQRILDKYKRTGAYLPKILEMKLSSLQARMQKQRGILGQFDIEWTHVLSLVNLNLWSVGQPVLAVEIMSLIIESIYARGSMQPLKEIC